MPLSEKDEEKVKAERKRIAMAKARLAKEKKKDPVFKAQFTNIENPATESTEAPPAEFNFEGDNYKLEDGKVYDLPLSVINHLNSLKIPIYGYELDHASGMLTPTKEPVNWKQRFGCIPVDASGMAAMQGMTVSPVRVDEGEE